MAWVVCHDAGSEDATVAWSAVAGAKYNLELKVAPFPKIALSLAFRTSFNVNRSQGQQRCAGRVSCLKLHVRVDITARPGLPVGKPGELA